MAEMDNTVVSGSEPRKRSHHIWTHKQRVCIHLLYHEFNHSIINRAKVFNKIFENELAADGIPYPGLSPAAIYQVYWQRKRTGKATRKLWKDVLRAPNTVQEHTLRGHMRARIAFVYGVLSAASTVRSSGNLTPQPAATSQDHAGLQATVKWKRSAATLMTPPSTADSEGEEEDESDRQSSSEERTRRSYEKQGSPVVMVPTYREIPASRNLANSVEAVVRNASSNDSPTKPRAIWKPLHPRRPRIQPSAQLVETDAQSVSVARSEMLLRRNMGPIPITPEKLQAAHAPLRDILEAEAHPCLPRFLFRTFSAKSHGLNSPDGFVSGRFANARTVPSGPPKLPDWNDILEHLDPSKTPLKCSKCNKDKCCNKTLDQKIPSPYISVSSDLVWVIRKMIVLGEQSSISVINTSALDPHAIYYVPPFQQELARKHVFHGREHRYKGYSEHLVWHEIPGSAIVKTLPFQELMAFAESDGLTRDTLRLAELRCSGTSSTEILKTMKQSKCRITPQVAALIANFVMFLGIGFSAPMEDVAFLVCEIVRGWVLRNAETTAERLENADRFMDTFYRESDKVLSIEEQVKLKYA